MSRRALCPMTYLPPMAALAQEFASGEDELAACGITLQDSDDSAHTYFELDIVIFYD